MVQAINREHFDGDQAVTCYTCHRGHLTPATALPLLLDRPVGVTSGDVKPAPDATVDAVLERYLRETGGDAWSKLTTRVMTGRLVTSEPAEYPAEMIQQAPSRLVTRIVVDGAPFLNVFDGDRGWSRDNGGLHDKRGDDLERFRRRAAFAAPADVRRIYPRLSLEGRTTVGPEPAVVLIGSSASGAEGSPVLQRAIGVACADRVGDRECARPAAAPVRVRGLPAGGWCASSVPFS